jgi:hypothetical protein
MGSALDGRSSNVAAEDFKWLLLVLNLESNTVSVRGYASRREASKAISEIEQSGKEGIDAVLVTRANLLKRWIMRSVQRQRRNRWYVMMVRQWQKSCAACPSEI